MVNNYSFIRYTRNNYTTSEDFISIQKSSISLSKKFLLKNNLTPEKNRFVILLYDPKKTAIGLHISKKKTSDSFALAYDKRGHGGVSITCLTFFKSFNIDVGKYTGRYPYSTIEDTKEGKTFVIELKKNDN